MVTDHTHYDHTHLFITLLVYPDGRVCISILHTPGDDPLGYETAAERWSPVQSIEKILLSVVSMLAGKWVWSLRYNVLFIIEPNDESGANVDASVSITMYVIDLYVLSLQKMWRENRKQFNDISCRLVRKSLGL